MAESMSHHEPHYPHDPQDPQDPSLASFLSPTSVDEQDLIDLASKQPPPPISLVSSSQPGRSPLLSRRSSSRSSLDAAQHWEHSSAASHLYQVRSTSSATINLHGNRSHASTPLSLSPSPTPPPPLPSAPNVTRSSTLSPTKPATTVLDDTTSSSSSSTSDKLARFLSQIAHTFSLILIQVFFPLLLGVYDRLAQNFQPIPHASSSFHPESRGSPPGSLANPPTQLVQQRRKGSNSFAERFKFMICSSFLLTSSLSISFYDSEPLEHDPSPSKDLVVDTRASVVAPVCSPHPLPVSISGTVVGLHQASPLPSRWSVHSSSTPSSTIPRLNAAGRLARNAASVSVILLGFFSSSWNLWFRSGLVIASLTWGAILTLRLSDFDLQIGFVLSHDPQKQAEGFLLHTSPSLSLSALEKTDLQKRILGNVAKLVKCAQKYDVAVNRSINAVQEVELVSRGYKLTHPLPPISRIEASSSMSPPQNRQSIISALGNAQSSLLSRSSSAGAGGVSFRRHAQRPLSLSLSTGRAASPSGRASPAFSSESIDAEWTRRGWTDPNSVGHPKRLVALRKSILDNLDAVSTECSAVSLHIKQLTDRDELCLLNEMYTLDGLPLTEAGEADANDLWNPGHHGSNASIDTADPDEDKITPRNSNGKRRSSVDMSLSARMADKRDGLEKNLTSPTPARKRLSLLSDGIGPINWNTAATNSSSSGTAYDRTAGASSSLSRQSSVLSDGLPTSYRSPRYNYVSEKSAGSGPNESAASKRLSYVSVSSVAAGSLATRSPMSLQAQLAAAAAHTPPHPSSYSYSASASPFSRTAEVRHNRRISINGSSSILNNVTGAAQEEPAEPLSLMGIKTAFETMHKTRRKPLCYLLALDFSLDDMVPVQEGKPLDLEQYWAHVDLALVKLIQLFEQNTETVSSSIRKQMGIDLGINSAESEIPLTDEANKHLLQPSDREADNQASPDRLEARRAPSRILGHLGLEDRFGAIMLCLRSIQSKLRVCVEDIEMKPPPELHGLDHDATDRVETTDGIPHVADRTQSGDLARIEKIERMFETIKEDLLSLSTEWEAGSKMLKKQKRNASSPLPPGTTKEMAQANAARDLDSPLEEEEDAAKAEGKAEEDSDDADLNAKDNGSGLFESNRADSNDDDNDDDDDDRDLAALLLRSTSPKHLPPLGLEQVFESIAGMAGIAGIGPKLSREQRIELTKKKRQQEEEAKTKKASHRHTIDPTSMVSELNEVMRSRRLAKEQYRTSVQPTASTDGSGCLTGNLQTESDGLSPLGSKPSPATTAAPFAAIPASMQLSTTNRVAAKLGSPLNLDQASVSGVFHDSHGSRNVASVPISSSTSNRSLNGLHRDSIDSLVARSQSATQSLLTAGSNPRTLTNSNHAVASSSPYRHSSFNPLDSLRNRSTDGFYQTDDQKCSSGYDGLALDRPTTSMTKSVSGGNGMARPFQNRAEERPVSMVLASSKSVDTFGRSGSNSSEPPFDLGEQVAAYARRKAAAAATVTVTEASVLTIPS